MILTSLSFLPYVPLISTVVSTYSKQYNLPSSVFQELTAGLEDIAQGYDTRSIANTTRVLARPCV